MKEFWISKIRRKSRERKIAKKRRAGILNKIKIGDMERGEIAIIYISRNGIIYVKNPGKDLIKYRAWQKKNCNYKDVEKWNNICKEKNNYENL